jgi:coenzyme Q-binding protein COQ10
MPKFEMSKNMPFNYKYISDIILDIEKYPLFLPWCSATRIINKQENIITADMVISFKIFSEQYRSKIVTEENASDVVIKVNSLTGPFKYLTTVWQISKIQEEESLVNFFIDFAFNSSILDSMIGLVFDEASKKMVSCFEKRTYDLSNRSNKPNLI